MDRQVKFRGYCPSAREWKYGYLVIDEHAKEPIYYIYVNNKSGMHDYIVDPISVGQYTGVNDSDGKEIYEGDYLLSEFIVYTYEVKYQSGGFRLAQTNVRFVSYDFNQLWFKSNPFKVFDNTYEKRVVMSQQQIRKYIRDNVKR